jgi:hypothetical protein
MQKTKPNTPAATPEEFVTAYLNGASVSAIASALKMTPQAVFSRARGYRTKYNINLPKRPWSDAPKRPGPEKRIDAAALNKLIEEHQKSSERTTVVEAAFAQPVTVERVIAALSAAGIAA